MPLEKIPSLRDFFTIVFKYKWSVLFLFLFTVSSVGVLTYVWPFSYEASAKVLVKFEREKAPLSGTSGSSNTVMTMRGTEEEILSEIEILNNRFLVEKVVTHFWDDLTREVKTEPVTFFQKAKALLKNAASTVIDLIMEIGYKLDLIQKLAPFESQVARMHKGLTIEVVKDSNVIEVKYRSWHPELSAAVVNKLTELYLDHHIDVHKIPHARDFFDEQKDIFLQGLRVSEDRLQEFKKQWDISSINIQRKLTLENIAELNQESNSILGNLMELESTVVSMRDTLSNRTNYIRAEDIALAAVNSDIVTRGLEEKTVIDESRIKGLKARYEILNDQLEYSNNRKRDLDSKELDLNRMERELELQEANYKRYLSRLEDTRIDEALDMAHIANVSVIEPATVPFSPVRRISFLPRRIMHLSIGIILGLMMALSYAFLAEYLDHTFNSSAQVERMLKVQCLASIRKE